MPDVFISYARSTEAEAARIAEALQGLGYGVWRDDQLPAHKPYAEVIEERLREAKAVVVIWSSEAVKSEWVQSEADHARIAHKLVQLTIDGAAPPMPFDRIQCVDLANWRGEPGAPAWRKVMESVADLAGRRNEPSSMASPQPAAQAVSICVLPFVNMSGDAEQEYFSDGISEDIITDLSKVSALSVTARNTAFTFKGRAVDVPQLARQLHVTHVLEGSVRKAGGRVRITAQLIDGAAGDHVWAERYDRDLDDIFALQDEISQAIVAALRLRLLPEEKTAIETRGTTNAQAYDLYLMARRYREIATFDARRHETIIRLCKRAVALDPGYAQAWTVMAAAQMTLVHTHGQPGDGGAAAIEQALALDPSLGEAHALRARALYRERRRDEAFVELALALKLDPDSFDVNARAGTIYYLDRQFEEAVRYYERASALSEADFNAPAGMLSACAAIGDDEGARRAAQMALHRADKALAQDRNNAPALTVGVQASAALGQPKRARELIDQALLLDPDNFRIRYNFACVLSLYFNDVEGALELLGRVFTEDPGGDYVRSARSDPDLDPIRGDSRFEGMLAAAEARLGMERS